MQNAGSKRIVALIAAFAVTIVMLFSSIYIPQHIHHECTGADCPVCEIMAQCATNLRSIVVVVALAATGLFLCVSIQENDKCESEVDFFCSLISQKVRLNN